VSGHGVGPDAGLIVLFAIIACVIGVGFIFTDSPEQLVGYGIAAAIGAVAALALTGQI
jgi:hypothetical protein